MRAKKWPSRKRFPGCSAPNGWITSSRIWSQKTSPFFQATLNLVVLWVGSRAGIASATMLDASHERQGSNFVGLDGGDSWIVPEFIAIRYKAANGSRLKTFQLGAPAPTAKSSYGGGIGATISCNLLKHSLKCFRAAARAAYKQLWMSQLAWRDAKTRPQCVKWLKSPAWVSQRFPGCLISRLWWPRTRPSMSGTSWPSLAIIGAP